MQKKIFYLSRACNYSVLAALFVFMSLSLQARGFGFQAEGGLYGDSRGLTDGFLNVQLLLSSASTQYTQPRWQVNINVLDIHFNKDRYFPGSSSSDNYVLVSASAVSIGFAALMAYKDNIEFSDNPFVIVAALLAAPHILPNLGGSFKLIGRGSFALRLYLGQEMSYYFIDSSGFVYGLKTDLRLQSNDVVLAAGVRRLIHNSFGENNWSASLSIGKSIRY